MGAGGGRAATTSAEVAIIGSGIVGLSCAFHLARRGRRCLLIDPDGPGAQTSYGNAGSISVGNVMPQATPGIALRGLRMLLDRRAPLKLDWRHLPSYAGWLRDFVRAGRRERVLAIVDAMHAINSASRAAWLDIAQACGGEALVAPSGYLHVYSEAATFAGGEWERELMRARGVRIDVLDRSGLRALEPGLGDGFERGVFQPDSLALRDPGGFCRLLHAHLVARGARASAARVLRIDAQPGSVRLHTDQGVIAASEVVVAAGAWSRALLAPLGVDVPIVPARGYHRMYRPQADVVQRPTLWAERYMVLSPMLGGIRMTSLKQLTALGSTPDFALIRRRDVDARRLFPALATDGASEWAGYRPCTPDSLPILDRVDEHVTIASGHGHLGITQGPVSGELIAQLLCGEPASLPLAPYRLARFEA